MEKKVLKTIYSIHSTIQSYYKEFKIMNYQFRLNILDLQWRVILPLRDSSSQKPKHHIINISQSILLFISIFLMVQQYSIYQIAILPLYLMDSNQFQFYCKYQLDERTSLKSRSEINKIGHKCLKNVLLSQYCISYSYIRRCYKFIFLFRIRKLIKLTFTFAPFILLSFNFNSQTSIKQILSFNKFIQMSSLAQSTEKPRSLYLAEIIAGACAAFSVSPLNVVVDKSVMQYAKNSSLNIWALAKENLKEITKKPLPFLGSFEFRWMYFVYIFTYAGSNLADHVSLTPEISHPIQKLGMVFLINTTCSLIKDKKYAVRFGQTPKKFPLASYALFFIRDLIAMASAFTIPPILGKFLSQKFGMQDQTGQRIAQVISPPMIQFIATPIHLLALSLYNQPTFNIEERVKSIKAIYSNALVMRMLRFLPAYGFGGIINIECRKALKKRMVE